MMTTLARRSAIVSSALVVSVAFVMAITMLKFENDVMAIALYVSPCFIMLFYHRPIFLVLLWPVLFAVEFLFPGIFIRFYGTWLHPMDVAYLFTIIYLTISLVIRREEFVRASKENPFLILFLVLVGVYTILYTPVHGKSAIGEARKFYFPFLFPLLTAISIKEYKDLRRLLMILFPVAAIASIAGFIEITRGRWIEHIAPAQGALLCLFAVFSIVIFHANGLVVTNRGMDAALSLMFLSLVIMTQHRSVWLAAGFGLLLLFGLYRRRAVFFERVFKASLLIIAVMIAAILVSPKFESSLTKNVGGFTDPHSDKTASWRIAGWRQQLDRVSNENIWLGEGIGGYYSWVYKGNEITVSPHNAYLQLLLKFGLLGVGIYALFAFSFFRKAVFVRKQLPPGQSRAYIELGIVNFGAAHGYMVAYGLELPMLIFVALAMSAVRLQTNLGSGMRQH